MQTKESWLKYVFTDEEFQDILEISKLKNGINLAAEKYNVKHGIIRSRLKSNNLFKGIPPQNKLKYHYNDLFFNENKDSLYYLMGLLASDGSFNGHDRIGIGQSHQRGKRLIYFIKGLIGSDHKIYKSGNSYSINLKVGHYLRLSLDKFNIVRNKTYLYELPNFISMKQFYSFIQGYIEGDGCIGYYDNGNGSFSLHLSIVGTENFIKNVNKKMPIKGQVTNIKNNLFQIAYNGFKAYKILTLIYDRPIYISGKYDIFIKSYNKYVNMVVTKKIYKKIFNQLSNGVPAKILAKKYNLRIGLIYNLKWKRKSSQKNLSNII